MGDKTKIDWCDASWNPVTGCLHGCEYCYARRIAERFGGHLATLVGKPIQPDEKKWEMGLEKNHVLDAPMRNTSSYEYMRIAGINAGRKMPYPFDFEPTFHRYKLDEPQHWKEPRTIFVCSMADLFGDWVPDEWIDEVIKACIKAPQHRYLFLTKNPARYEALYEKGILPAEGVNGLSEVWLGSSAPTPKTPFFYNRCARTFVSIEPILQPFHYTENGACYVDWVIVGAETGNRKGKVIPKKEWIMEIVDHCRNAGTPLFMKESLREIMGDDFRQEFPWEA